MSAGNAARSIDVQTQAICVGACVHGGQRMTDQILD